MAIRGRQFELQWAVYVARLYGCTVVRWYGVTVVRFFRGAPARAHDERMPVRRSGSNLVDPTVSGSTCQYPAG